MINVIHTSVLSDPVHFNFYWMLSEHFLSIFRPRNVGWIPLEYFGTFSPFLSPSQQYMKTDFQTKRLKGKETVRWFHFIFFNAVIFLFLLVLHVINTRLVCYPGSLPGILKSFLVNLFGICCPYYLKVGTQANVSNSLRYCKNLLSK